MSAGKEIRNKIKSVQNTQKITKAMQMVSTSKMRRTQDRMKQARPYAEKIKQIIANLAQVNPLAREASTFLRQPDVVKKIGIIFITTDKGLCGGLNSNAIKVFYENIRKANESMQGVEVCSLGQKGFAAANRISANVISSAIGLGDIPKLDKIIGPLSGLFQKFQNKEIDAVYVIYTKFVNTMKQNPVCEQLLPLSDYDLKVTTKHQWDYIYEPSPTEVIDDLVKRYLESIVYHSLCENMASEQASRMVAMKSATDNAGETIGKLKLVYNKSRQAAITQELAEICAGAAAV